MSIKGKDKWGEYHDFTGHEGNGCFWCGSIIRGRGRYRYCCPEHRQLYAEHYSWTDARAAFIERSRKRDTHGWPMYLCQDCSKKMSSTHEFIIHHIVPLDGAYRALSWLNRPENLVLLCNECHGKRHRQLNYLNRKVKMCMAQYEKFVELDGQLVFTMGD